MNIIKYIPITFFALNFVLTLIFGLVAFYGLIFAGNTFWLFSLDFIRLVGWFMIDAIGMMFSMLFFAILNEED